MLKSTGRFNIYRIVAATGFITAIALALAIPARL
jgi:hypothetical protein